MASSSKLKIAAWLQALNDRLIACEPNITTIRSRKFAKKDLASPIFEKVPTFTRKPMWILWNIVLLVFVFLPVTLLFSIKEMLVMFIHLQLLVMTAKRGDNPFPSALIKNANTGKKVLDGIDKGNKSELKQLARQETIEQHRAVLEKFRELLAEDVKPHNLV